MLIWQKVNKINSKNNIIVRILPQYKHNFADKTILLKYKNIRTHDKTIHLYNGSVCNDSEH